MAIAPTRPRAVVENSAILVCAASMLIFGFWAYFAPDSFSSFISYEPYNRHLIHDAGAFQLGIGVSTGLSVFCTDSRLVALTGFTVASGLHALSHYTDRHIGGHGYDVPALGVFPVIALMVIFIHIRGRRR